jgi:predicted MFS family arabinose efflux permease
MTEVTVDSLTARIARNIKLNYVYTMLMNTQLDKGIWMLFLGYRGLNLIQIGLVEAIYQLSSLVFGIPAGAIGDLIGRRTSLILSIITKILSYVLILISTNIAGYSASFILGAVSIVLYNTASESIAYESVSITGKSDSYKQIYGNILALAFISTALGIAVGGFIAAGSYENVYYAMLFVMALALVPAFLFAETRGVTVNGKSNPAGMLRLFADSLKVIAADPLILFLLVLIGCITTADQTIYMYCQKYFQLMGIPVSAIGLIIGVDSLFAAFGARYAYVLARLSPRNVVVIVPAMIFGAYTLLAIIHNPIGVPLLWLATIFVVAFWPILSDLINSRVPSENRATILAFKGQLSSAAIMILFPIIGFFAEQSSLSLAFLWLLVILLPLVAYSVIRIRKSSF